MSSLLRENIMTSIAWLIIMLIAVTSYAYTYKGDGTFEDRGFTTASRRYWLSLDTISINKPYKKNFTVGYLPENFMTLSFLYKLDGDLLKKQYEIFDIISRIKIRLKISIKETGEVKYFYEGKLQESGVKNGKYYLRGLGKGGFFDGKGNSYLEWEVSEYYFNEVVTIFGFETSFPKKIDRIIEFEIIEPLTKPIKDGGDFLELVIHGGGWK